jgi:hypothetical protein
MKEFKITCILGPQAEAISNALRFSDCITYRDNSVPGMKILDVYADGDSVGDEK